MIENDSSFFSDEMLIDSERCSNQFHGTAYVFKLLAIAARFSSSWPRRKGRWSRMVRSGFIVPCDATTSLMRSRRPYGSGLCGDRGNDQASSSPSFSFTLILFDTIRETLLPKEEEKDRIERPILATAYRPT